MIFRALFWIGLVALLMPWAPQLGGANAAAQPARQRPALCAEDTGCAGGPAFLDALQEKAVQGLAAVKAEIDADRKARARRL